MSSSTLYRKYRPRIFADVIGQEVVVTTLSNALKLDHLGHAYLFTGPRGTGKTTLARIFAASANCLNRKKDGSPCGTCEHCKALQNNASLDIIEIDAASHTGVDNIRELRDGMTTMPSLGKYKIYIIDEVHMLSTGAFNALLKIMEEPPEHVIFLLATTALQKVPETIVSRCQRFDLRNFALAEIREKLRFIADSEKISIDDEALTLIAKAAKGALRDAESILTQLHALAPKKITAVEAARLLGATSSLETRDLLGLFLDRNVHAALQKVRALREHGKDVGLFTTDLITIFRDALLHSCGQPLTEPPFDQYTDEEKRMIEAITGKIDTDSIAVALEYLERAAQDLKWASIPELPLEIALVKIDSSFRAKYPSPPPGPLDTAPQEKTVDPKKAFPKTNKKTEPPKAPLAEIAFETIQDEWQRIINTARDTNASLSVALQTALPRSLKANCLTFSVAYPFHQERLNEAKNRLTLEAVFDSILGSKIEFDIVCEEKESAREEASNPLLSQALELLGGKVI